MKHPDLRRKRKYADVVAKVPIDELKQTRTSLFIDFMTGLIEEQLNADAASE